MPEVYNMHTHGGWGGKRSLSRRVRFKEGEALQTTSPNCRAFQLSDSADGNRIIPETR
jgi:hypothetical protein